ncbi:MAG: TIGR03619 family F420-dependent LLM class oxidoreductase [Sphingomonadales bacterium]|nr:TIGR03619 family F420-dependent LLM class oxidoreductase [Sphingomonadales bacterium]
MKLAFSMPNMVRLKAMQQPWEADITGPDQQRLAKLAEELGFEMIAVPEHHIIPRAHVELSGSHYLAAYPGMAFFAGATSRIKLNSCIAIQPVQHPIITAKALATIDWQSGGRMMITFAVGWLKEEFDLLGVPFHERGARAEEYTKAIIELWTKDEPAFEGKWVSFKDVAFEPKPVQKPHPPIWFGGGADAVLKRVARYGQGWWPFLVPNEQLPEKIDFIRSQPDYNGQLRDVFVGLSQGRVGEGHVVVDDPMCRADMTKQEIIDRLGYFADLGVTMSGLPIPPLSSADGYEDYCRWVAEEIMPAVA